MSNAMDWLNTNGGGGDSQSSGNISFAEVGDTVVGTIETAPRLVTTQYGDRLVLELSALDGTTAAADGNQVTAGDVVTVWVKPGAMARAITNAVRTAGCSGLEIGGKLAIKHSALGEKKPGRNPAKLYDAKYEAPAAKPTNVDDLFG